MMNKRAAELGLDPLDLRQSAGARATRTSTSPRATWRGSPPISSATILIIYHYFGEKEFTWNKIRQLNRNPLLTMDLGADGLKTGDFAATSGYGLVGSAVQNGQRLIVVVDGLKTGAERAEEARKLLEWGFRSFDAATAVPGRRRRRPRRRSTAAPRAKSPLVCDGPVKVFRHPRGRASG